MTLLSKDIVGKVVDALSQVIKGTISDEVREAGLFSVQIDTTQDRTWTSVLSLSDMSQM